MLKSEDLQEFFDKSSGPHIGFKAACHDCGKPVCIEMDMDKDGKVTVRGGAMYCAQTGATNADKSFFLKCDNCFSKDSILKRYMPCEVYTRSIGYLRPVKQMNEGKQAEVAMRLKFKV